MTMEKQQYVKLEIFIPETHFSQLRSALQAVDAGHIGNYDSCAKEGDCKPFTVCAIIEEICVPLLGILS